LIGQANHAVTERAELREHVERLEVQYDAQGMPLAPGERRVGPNQSQHPIQTPITTRLKLIRTRLCASWKTSSDDVHKVDTPTRTTTSPNDPPRTQPKLETSSKQRGRHPRLDRRVPWPRHGLCLNESFAHREKNERPSPDW
jgi:hypothetical protein